MLINKTKEVLSLHKSSIPTADPWTWCLPTARFRPDMYRRATRHRNALSKGTLLSKSQGGLDQMHSDLLSTHYHLCCNRDHKLHLSIRNRRTEAVIKRIWFCQVLIQGKVSSWQERLDQTETITVNYCNWRCTALYSQTTSLNLPSTHTPSRVTPSTRKQSRQAGSSPCREV